MKKSLLLLVVLFMGIIAFNACKKTDDADDKDVITAEDLSVQEDFSEQTDLDVDIAIEERGGGGSCPVVTFAQPAGTWPNTITVDYGTGCTRPDGRVLKGKIIVAQTAEIRTAGAIRSLTHEGFFVDDVLVGGTKTWTNNGKDAAGNWSYTKTATDMKLTFADGTSTTWSKTRISTMIEGGTTLLIADDVWSSTGTASGINRQGDSFTATITDPLIKKALCRWISKGIIEFTRNGNTRTLDFGDGSCDRFGTLTTANGNSFSIRLRR